MHVLQLFKLIFSAEIANIVFARSFGWWTYCVCLLYILWTCSIRFRHGKNELTWFMIWGGFWLKYVIGISQMWYFPAIECFEFEVIFPMNVTENYLYVLHLRGKKMFEPSFSYARNLHKVWDALVLGCFDLRMRQLRGSR